MKHMAVGSLTPNIGIAWPIATDEKNNAKTHRKSLQHIIASAIALMAVVETVPKADSRFAPKAVTKIVAIPVVIVVAAAVMQTLAFAKYSAVIESIHNSNKGY